MHEKSKCRPEAGLVQQKVLSGKTELKRDNCYNCGKKGHNANNYLSKDKDTKCFRCNHFGHISKHCPQKVENSNVRSLVSDCMMNKVVTVENQNYNALFDTGSKYNIMSQDVPRSRS